MNRLGALRLKVGHDRGLVEEGWRILWVVDFPMFEKGEGRFLPVIIHLLHQK